MKAPEKPALFHDISAYHSKNDSVGKLTWSPLLSRDWRVAHFLQGDLRKILPPSRATQRNKINTRNCDDEQKFTIVPRRLLHQQWPHERSSLGEESLCSPKKWAKVVIMNSRVEMKTTNMVVWTRILTERVEKAHNFNICVMSEVKNGGKKADTVQFQTIAMFYIMNRLKINVKPVMGKSGTGSNVLIISISNCPVEPRQSPLSRTREREIERDFS